MPDYDFFYSLCACHVSSWSSDTAEVTGLEMLMLCILISFDDKLAFHSSLRYSVLLIYNGTKIVLSNMYNTNENHTYANHYLSNYTDC